MNETQLLATLRRDIDQSTGDYYEKLNLERAKALRYYLGEPLGNEKKGRSSLITTEVADTIEGMLPQILKVFVASERAVFFDPVGPEDEQAAKQETDYVNHVFYKENEGFHILYSWFKDALLSKNGIVKYYWEEKETVVTESYTGLDESELMTLLSDDDVEIVEQTENLEEVQGPMGPTVVSFYDVKIRRTEMDGKVRVENVPPEEFIIDVEWNKQGLQDVPFCAHETEATISDLKARGFDVSEISKVAGSSTGEDYDNIEEEERFADISDSVYGDDEQDSSPDPSMRRVKLTECYKRVDFDGDGYAELRRILLVNEKHIIENEEIDYVPFESITPIVMTHRFFGRSAADQSMDIQLQKTMLTRNIMDNLYLINNQRHAVVEGEVNLGDLLDSTPGSAVRMSAPGMVQPLPTQPFNGHAFGMLEYFDSIKENRTGQTKYNQGMDADSLNKTATGINRIMDASAQRMELIARLFGEGVKRLMLGIHRLLLQNQDKQKVIELRGQWVPISPNEWKDRTNMSVVVGLGTENRDKMLGHLMTIVGIQKEAMQGGLSMVNEANLYNTAVKLIENAGLKHPNLYFTDPATVPPQPPQPDPQMELVKGQLQIAQEGNQVKDMDSQRSYDIDQKKLALEARRVAIEEGKLQLEQARTVDDQTNAALDRELAASQSVTEALTSAGGNGAGNA